MARPDVALTLARRYARRRSSYACTQLWPPLHQFTGNEGDMTTFDKREDGFEKKFAHDEELQFKAGARRNKLLGMWAAEKMGMTPDQAQAYAKEVVMADFDETGDHDVFKKIRQDFDAKKINVSDPDLRRVMDELMAQAIDQIKKSG
jgi:hypothetical protein